MHTSLLTIQNELEKAREKLKGVEENIKRSIGRDINNGPPLIRTGFKRTVRQLDAGNNETPLRQRLQNEGIKSRLGEYVRNTESRDHDFRGRINRRVSNNEPPSRMRKVEKVDERVPAKKRLGEQPAVTVFSRLSGPPKDDEFEEKESSNIKITSQVIVQDAPSRKDVLAAQNGDNQSKARNRRMFGALLGTLQKFRQEENQLKEKEEKRAQVEKKLEEAALREKEELKKKRQELFTSRRQQQIEIRQLEYKLVKLKQLTDWESTKKHLTNFIQTKAHPKIFYLPKTHNDKTLELLAESSKRIQRMIEDKRREVEQAIADHANIKKEAKEDDNADDDDHRDDMMDVDEGEINEEDCSKSDGANGEALKINIKREDMNGVSDKENDMEAEEEDGEITKPEESPPPSLPEIKTEPSST